MYKISVVIPVYNVKTFVKRCATSLMRQAFKDVEFIFVDDASTDGSIAILENVVAQYPENDVRILHHEENKGLPAARNTGLSIAKGEYVFHCDSDDFVESYMLEKMYSAAKSCDADFVWCDWWLSYAQNERRMKMPKWDTPEEATKCMLSGGMKYNVWNKLVKRSLYVDNSIEFPTGHAMGEDMTMMMLCACARKVAYVPEALYHYVRTNEGAMTQRVTERQLVDVRYNVERTTEFLLSRFGDLYRDEIAFLKLATKFPFLISDDEEMLKLWKEWYRDVDDWIGKNPYESGRAKMLQKWARDGHFWLIKIYYKIVYKFVYSLMYR